MKSMKLPGGITLMIEPVGPKKALIFAWTDKQGMAQYKGKIRKQGKRSIVEWKVANRLLSVPIA